MWQKNRRRRGRRLLLAPLVALTVVLFVLAATDGQPRLGRETLRTEAQTVEDLAGPPGRRLRFLDKTGEEVASAAIWTEVLSPHLSLLRFELSHQDNLTIRDLTLRFSYVGFQPLRYR